MIERWIRIKGDQCFAKRGPALQDGDTLQITPAPGIWIEGQYGYDAEQKEHYWKSDDEHFVGLISGMKVRVS